MKVVLFTLFMSLPFALFALLGGCTSKSTVDPVVQAGCNVEATISGAFASAIAGTIPCDDGGAIQADMLNALGKANLCRTTSTGTMKAQGIIGDIVCPIAVNSALGVFGSKLPTSWKCHPGTGGPAGYAELLKGACSKAIGL